MSSIFSARTGRKYSVLSRRSTLLPYAESKNSVENFGEGHRALPIDQGEQSAPEFARNPELLVVRNGRSSMRRYKKSRNPKITIKLGRKRMTYRQVIKKYGFKKGPSMWRRSAKFHAGERIGCSTGVKRRKKSRKYSRKSVRITSSVFPKIDRRGRKARRAYTKRKFVAGKTVHRRTKARNGVLTIKIGKHGYAFRQLTKKFGVKKAAQIWKSKPKFHYGRRYTACRRGKR